MKQQVCAVLSGVWRYLRTFLKWVLLASATGLICGGIGVLFSYGIQYATQARDSFPWLLFLLPLGGLGIVGLYHLAGFHKDGGTNLILTAIRSDQKPPLRMAPLIFISTIITHLLGGSAGREGAALQIGGSIGSFLGERFRLDEKNSHIITMCGMSAVFSALFGTPLTAAIFSLEVISVGVLYYSALVPCVVSSLIAYGVSRLAGLAPTAFTLSQTPSPDEWLPFLQVGVLSAVCAGVSILFCIAMHQSGKWYQKLLPNPYLRIAVGGILIISLTLLVGNQDYNGAGTGIIHQAITAGSSRPEAFALKILFTALTLGAGYKGGEIVPTFFIGATLGCTLGGLLGLPAGFGAAVGLVSLFCGVVNCPITSLILSLELFGNHNILLFALACAVSYMLSGRYSLYTSQKIVYSKLETTYINADAK